MPGASEAGVWFGAGEHAKEGDGTVKGIKLGSGFKLTKDDKIVRDEGARLDKLPVNLRIAAKNSTKVKVAKGIRPRQG